MTELQTTTPTGLEQMAHAGMGYVSSEKPNRGRGRPRSRLNEIARRLHPNLRSRQSINNRQHAAVVGTLAFDLGLVDANYADRATGKPLLIKFAVIGRHFGGEFMHSDAGKQWLVDNWLFVVEESTVDMIQWFRLAKSSL